MSELANFLSNQPMLALFATMALGHAVGAVSIKGFSLGSGAVLFVALAVGAFAPASAMPSALGSLGLLLFLYGVGLAYGKQFFDGLTSPVGLRANAASIIGVVIMALMTVATVWLFPNVSLPETLGGSADLTGSNNTRTEQTAPITPDDFSGRYLHYGIREHGMAAAMNGIALHGGLIPYGGTFLVFSDYARPAMRLSSLMGIRVVYVMTHDSIGLGEDGPTHQPVEHLAALRAIPNHHVFRPADAMETAECWELALGEAKTPATIALTRQGLPALRTETSSENRCALGAYEMATAGEQTAVTLFASGSEVQIAMEARARLEAAGCPTRVVSVPCMELFERQDPDYQRAIIGDGGVRIAIEAGVSQGWARFIGEDGVFIGTATKGENPMTALEVVIFPEALRGQGEGHYAWDAITDHTAAASGAKVKSAMTNGTVQSTGSAAPKVKSAMTNGTVASSAAAGGSRTLTVSYKEGSKQIVVPPQAPVVAFEPSDKAVLQPGAKVFVVAAPEGGKLGAKFVAVGKDGLTPPM